MTGLVFIVGLVIVSGLVAYVGDNLGRKIGKRKMRLFGLRPKHTSIVVAVVTGMIITTITVAALMLGSKDIRRMILEWEQIQEDLITARAEFDESKQELEQAKAEIASKDLDVILKQELIDEKEAELGNLNTQIDQLAVQINDLTGSVTDLQETVTEKEEQLLEKEEEIAQRTEEITSLEFEMADLQSRLMNIQSEIEELNSSIEGLNVEVNRLGQEKLNLENEVAQKIAEITKIRFGGVMVENGELLKEFGVSTDLSDADIIRHVRSAISDWNTNDPKNIYGNPIIEPGADQYTEVIKRIRNIRKRFGDDQAVIRIFSDAYVFQDEAVPVILKVERNLIIYDEGEVILKRRIGVDDSIGVIRKELYEMFESLEQQGKDDGMIFEGIEKTVFFDSAVVVETARKASYYATDIYIQIVAKKDIYSIEYLVLAPDIPEDDNLKIVIEEIK